MFLCMLNSDLTQSALEEKQQGKLKIVATKLSGEDMVCKAQFSSSLLFYSNWCDLGYEVSSTTLIVTQFTDQ